MAPYDDHDPRESHRRESDARKKRHERRNSRGHGATSAAEGSGGRSKQRLSVDALAQLNDINTRDHIPEPAQARRPERKRRKHRRRREEYEVVDAEYESPRRERERVYDTREADREDHSPRRTRRRRNEYSESEREPESPRRPRRTRAYAEPDFDDDDDDDRNYPQTEREGTRTRRKKKRIVSGAIVEEGRSTPDLRGGVTSKHSSYNSIEHEKSLHYSAPRWNKKKKRCKSA